MSTSISYISIGSRFFWLVVRRSSVSRPSDQDLGEAAEDEFIEELLER